MTFFRECGWVGWRNWEEVKTDGREGMEDLVWTASGRDMIEGAEALDLAHGH